MTGREPMNPRGRQFALGGTYPRWDRLESLTRRQTRLLQLSYKGWHPLVYSRYGYRQWAAPLPRSRVVVKDPFAVLSLPAIVGATDALPVVVYRHPGAVLRSYRRMAWTAAEDSREFVGAEIRAVAAHSRAKGMAQDAVSVLGIWRAIYRQVLEDRDRLPSMIIVSHEEVAQGGDRALSRLLSACHLPDYAPQRVTGGADQPGRLHNFERDPSSVATAWRNDVDPGELEVFDALSNSIMTALNSQRFDLSH